MHSSVFCLRKHNLTCLVVDGGDVPSTTDLTSEKSPELFPGWISPEKLGSEFVTAGKFDISYALLHNGFHCIVLLKEFFSDARRA